MIPEATTAAPIISRRTIIQGAAWTIPVVAVAAAAPAAAASVGALCNTANNGEAATVVQGIWGPQTGLIQEGGAYVTGYAAGGFNSWQDNASVTAPKTFTATYTFEATAATEYLIDFTIATSPGNGNNGAAGSAPQGVVVTAGSTVLADVVTNSRDNFASTQTVGGQKQLAWWESSSTEVSKSYTSSTGGVVTLTFTFTLASRGGAAQNGVDAQVNDDIDITTPVVIQTGCGAAED